MAELTQEQKDAQAKAEAETKAKAKAAEASVKARKDFDAEAAKPGRSIVNGVLVSNADGSAITKNGEPLTVPAE